MHYHFHGVRKNLLILNEMLLGRLSSFSVLTFYIFVNGMCKSHGVNDRLPLMNNWSMAIDLRRENKKIVLNSHDYFLTFGETLTQCS